MRVKYVAPLADPVGVLGILVLRGRLLHLEGFPSSSVAKGNRHLKMLTLQFGAYNFRSFVLAL